VEIREPRTEEEMEAYYRLRWKILRKPWNQPYGSEKDDMEENAFHIIALMNGNIIGVARLHFNYPQEAQIRYMAVDERYRNIGIGSRMLKKLEEKARRRGVEKIILDARENAVEFYRKNGYRVVRPSKILFGEIKHFLMEKKFQNV